MCDCSGQATTTLGRFGAYAGDRASRALAKKFKSWTGFGDYTLRTNSLINAGGIATGQPIIETRGRTTRISFREYLGDISTGATAGGFHRTTYDLNPGNAITFPWLAAIALQYEQYKPLGIIFEFRSTATDTTTATASVGSVIMSTDYDPTDPPPNHKGEMLNSAYSSESKSSENQLHGIECDPEELQRKVFYVRRYGETTSDIRDYDIGVTTIATQGGGLPANSSIGSLYVHYDFEFYKEQPTGGLNAKNMLFQRNFCIGTGASMGDLFNTAVDPTRNPYAGVDMGIYIDVGTSIISIPRKWAGATIYIEITSRSPTGWNPFTTSVGAKNGLTVIPDPAADIAGAVYGDWAFESVAANPMYICTAHTLVRLDSVVSSEVATLATASPGFIPNVGSNIYATFLFQVVPENFYLNT